MLERNWMQPQIERQHRRFEEREIRERAGADRVREDFRGVIMC